MKGATVLTVSSRALLDACDAMGLDTEALLTAAGLPRAEVTDPDARIPVEKMTALWRENLTYAQVLDDVRSTMGRAYLGQRELSIAEVAYLLGFSEQSSFTRAFRRWTGVSPVEFRRARTT